MLLPKICRYGQWCYTMLLSEVFTVKRKIYEVTFNFQYKASVAEEWQEVAGNDALFVLWHVITCFLPRRSFVCSIFPPLPLALITAIINFISSPPLFYPSLPANLCSPAEGRDIYRTVRYARIVSLRSYMTWLDCIGHKWKWSHPWWRKLSTVST